MPALKRSRMCAGLLGALLATVLVLRPDAAGAQPRKSQPTGLLEVEGGPLAAWVYVPSSYRPQRSMPLVLFLHGCGGTAVDQADLTAWSKLAEAKGFLALYPQAPEPARCWWFTDPEGNSYRDGGDAGAIAQTTLLAMDRWSVDARRVHLSGYSAGGTMASVMGATYPDLFASIAMVEGCPYRCSDASGEQAYAAMGTFARRLPVFIVAGRTSGGYPFGGELALQQWLGTNDLVDNGALDSSVPRQPDRTTTFTSGRGLPYDVEVYVDARGEPLIERWVVYGMFHEYPEPGGDLPDATTGALAFFEAHPMPAAKR